MPKRRPDYSEPVVKTLFALSNNVCSFVSLDDVGACEERLTDPSWKRVKARISHIRGWAPGSARYDPTYGTPMAFENLLLLCPNHHSVVDDLEPHRYTVPVLEAMKERSTSLVLSSWATEERLTAVARQLLVQTRLHLEVEHEQSTRSVLAEAIGRLPEREKVVLTLHYYEGLTVAQIGEVLGVSSSWAGRLRRRALTELDRQMEQ